MTEFSKERIQQHLEHLAKQIDLLKDFQSQSLAMFNDPKQAYAVYHAFLLAIQNVMDIGGHILAAVFRTPFSEYDEIIPKLAEQKVVSRELAQKMTGIAGFRNKLVHDYIEAKKVQEYLQKEMDQLIAFSQQIIAFIEKH